MKQMKEWLKFAVGVIGFTAVIISSAQADSNSDTRNPVELKAIELGTSMKLWAVGFGASAKKNAVASKQAFANDIERIKNSKTMQYQQQQIKAGQEQWTRNREQIQAIPGKVAKIPRDIVNSLGSFVQSITGTKSDAKN